MSDIKVSVIIPVYNVEQYIGRCLDSVVKQSFEDKYEIICVNDCTPDNSEQVLIEYSQKYPELVRYVSNSENLGLGRTRNRGVLEAKGDYVMFIDSDDYIKKDYIQNYYEEACKSKVDCIIGGYIRKSYSKENEYRVNNSVWSTITYSITCAKMYRKNFLVENKIAFKEYRCGEDIHFNACAYCCNMKYSVIDYAGYYYWVNEKSITGTMNYKKNLEEMIFEMFSDVDTQYGNRISASQRNIIAYDCFVQIVYALCVFNRGCGIALMREKYKKCMNYMEKRFGGIDNNPYIKIGQPKDQTMKINMAVWFVLLCRKVKLDNILFNIFALM